MTNFSIEVHPLASGRPPAWASTWGDSRRTGPYVNQDIALVPRLRWHWFGTPREWEDSKAFYPVWLSNIVATSEPAGLKTKWMQFVQDLERRSGFRGYRLPLVNEVEAAAHYGYIGPAIYFATSKKVEQADFLVCVKVAKSGSVELVNAPAESANLVLAARNLVAIDSDGDKSSINFLSDQVIRLIKDVKQLQVKLAKAPHPAPYTPPPGDDRSDDPLEAKKQSKPRIPLTADQRQNKYLCDCAFYAREILVNDYVRALTGESVVALTLDARRAQEYKVYHNSVIDGVSPVADEYGLLNVIDGLARLHSLLESSGLEFEAESGRYVLRGILNRDT